MKQNKVYAVVSTYNRGDKINQTIDSLLDQTIELEKIIIVDNSTENLKAVKLKYKTSKVKIVRLGKNLGPGWARNIGLTYCKNADYVMFVDDDIVFEKLTAQYLVEAFTQKSNCVASMPVIYFKERKEKVWSAGSSVNLITGQTLFYTQIPIQKYKSIDAAASVIMVKPESIKKSGWYDPIYFFSYEDADFYYRLRQKLQGDIYLVRSSIAYHDIPFLDSKSYYRLALRSYYIARGRIIFLSRYGKFFPLNLIFVLGFSLYYFYLGLKLGFPLSGFRYIEGIVDGLKVILNSNSTVDGEEKFKEWLNVKEIKDPRHIKNYTVTSW